MNLDEQRKYATQQLNLSAYEPLVAVESENKKGWINYGLDNLYPKYLIDLYYNSPIHNSLTNRIAMMINGKGSNTILDSALKGISFDLKLQGQFVAEVIWSLDGSRVAKINHLPFENCRIAFEKDTDNITGIWYSRDWSNLKKNPPRYITKFAPELAKELPRQCIYTRIPTSGSLWYAKPDYYGALNYIELSHQMGLYHINNIMNGLFPSFIVNQRNGVPTREETNIIKNEWERRLSGAQNAGKFIMTFTEPNQQAPEIIPFPISDADKQYEFLSEETAKQIMVGHGVTSPLLFGIRDNTGFGSNKDEMEVALDIFNHQVIQPYQRLICDSFEAIFPDVTIELNSPFAQKTAVAVTQTDEKKKVECSEDCNHISEEDGKLWLEHLRAKAEYIDESEWELLSDEEVTDADNELNHTSEFLSARQYSNPNKKDEKDSGLYKVRYYYSKNLTWKDGEVSTRDFCQEMVGLSKSGALFRYEDIIDMGKAEVNGQFAPSGQRSYDIWKYKGGVYCRHAWFRKIYFRKKVGGKFLPNKGLQNDKVVNDKQANELFPKGIEAVRPNDMPNRASLKY